MRKSSFFSFVLLASIACGGAVAPDDPAAGPAGDVSPKVPGATRARTCAEAGGKCGPTPDLPCRYDERYITVDERCEDYAPCCVPLGIPDSGRCWHSDDCFAADAPPGRPASVAECIGSEIDEAREGQCRCSPEYGVPLLEGRCGPKLLSGEHFVCTISPTDVGASEARFAGTAGSCDGAPCSAGAACFRGGNDEVFCMHGPAPRSAAKLRWCEVANCGDIRCDAPLRCIDDTRGVCVR